MQLIGKWKIKCHSRH